MRKVPARVSKRRSNEPLRDAAVRILKLKGESSVSDLCKSLNLTQTAVRRCLSALQLEGLVEHQPDTTGRGRPVNSYKLTAKGRRVFP